MALPARSAPHSTLRLTVRHHIWRVSLDGAFYGDYRSLAGAMEGAEDAATSLRAHGRVVTIIGLPAAA
ncbi:MAG TPA: hypothetical protein VM915_17560 [Verrucomicrobiae bacterium]|nr:hypothetical protein [Verrucomicrobiae bacterium]